MCRAFNKERQLFGKIRFVCKFENTRCGFENACNFCCDTIDFFDFTIWQSFFLVPKWIVIKNVWPSKPFHTFSTPTQVLSLNLPDSMCSQDSVCMYQPCLIDIGGMTHTFIILISTFSMVTVISWKAVSRLNPSRGPISQNNLSLCAGHLYTINWNIL